MINELLERIQSIENEIIQSCETYRAEELGFDRRCGDVLVPHNKQWIVIYKNNKGTMNYYGGLEYVDDEYVTELTTIVLYSREDSRIDGHLSSLDEPEEEECCE